MIRSVCILVIFSATILLWTTSPARAQCDPACGPGFLCYRGECVSACNPLCDEGLMCTDEGECVEPPTSECYPPCPSGYLCHEGNCVSACNPLCEGGLVCTDEGECVSAGADGPSVNGGHTDTPLEPGSGPTDPPGIGIRAGIGTDVSGGLGFGGGGNYYFGHGLGWEVGLEIFVHSSEESSSDYGHTYNEQTDLIAVALLANYLWNYASDESGIYFVTGSGLAFLSVEWEESSPTDTSLGTTSGSGSSYSDDGSTGGWVLNLGLGYAFGPGLDIRIEAPLIVSFDAPGDSAGFIPTFTGTLGYRF